MVIVPIFSLYEVVPVPLPHIPARTHPRPSTAIPVRCRPFQMKFCIFVRKLINVYVLKF